MIYKIQANFEVSFNNLIKILKSNYNLLFSNNAFYVCEKNNINDVQEFRDSIKAIKNTHISYLDVDNLKYESEQVIEWCKNFLVQQDIIKLENEKQEQLQDTMVFLDKFDEEINKIIAQGGGNSE